MQWSSYQDDRIGPDIAREDDMKRRQPPLTRSHEGIHSDTYDEEVFAFPHGQDRHLGAGFICGKMDDLTGLTRLAHRHTSCCHEFQATIARLLCCRQASSLDIYRLLTMHETFSVCITKHDAMAKLARQTQSAICNPHGFFARIASRTVAAANVRTGQATCCRRHRTSCRACSRCPELCGAGGKKSPLTSRSVRSGPQRAR